MRGLARGLGSKDIVTSPTFTINQIYHGHDRLIINHFDFYRLNEPGVVKDLLEEAINDPDVITVIEWSDIVKDVLPPDHITVELKLVATNTDERQIIFRYPESEFGLIKNLETMWLQIEP